MTDAIIHNTLGKSCGAQKKYHLVANSSNPLINNYQSIVNKRVGWLEFLNTFSDDNECLELYFFLKFEGKSCENCGRSVVENYARVTRTNENGVPKRAFRCRTCRNYIYPFSDTIFRGSAIPVRHLFLLMYTFAGTKNSISAKNMTLHVDIAYKAAHRTMMLIRKCLCERFRAKMSGVIEIDEAFIGKGSKFNNWSGISTRKQPIIGMIDRETKHVRMFLVNNRRADTLFTLIRENVEEGSTVYTDSWRGYNCLTLYYKHETVDHSRAEFVRGSVHTNTIENIWGKFKRNLRGVHIKISDKYVQLYVNEYCWRYNSKNKTQIQLFDDILRRTFFSGFD